jgi:hypothetical protein
MTTKTTDRFIWRKGDLIINKRGVSTRAYNPDEPRDEKGEWTSGAGAPGDAGIEQIKTSSTSTSTLPEGAHDFIQKQAEDFHRAGGTIKIMSAHMDKVAMDFVDDDDLKAAYTNFAAFNLRTEAVLRNAYDGRGPLADVDGLTLDRMSEGLRFTEEALNRAGGSHVAVAFDKDGNVAGAMSFSPNTRSWDSKTQSYEGGPVKIGYLGSLGTTPGTGTALQVAVAKVAAAAGKDISSTATDQALSYHSLIGRTLDETNHSSWTKEQVAEVASLSP